MNLLSDSLVVLGSRIGFGIDPNNKTYLIRHDRHPGKEINLNIGIEVNGVKRVLPFSTKENKFKFIDQESKMSSIRFTAIDSELGIKLKLKMFIPFKPQDKKVSTTPAVFFKVTAEKMLENYRWEKSICNEVKGNIFIDISCKDIEFLNNKQDEIVAKYNSEYRVPADIEWNDDIRALMVQDKIKVVNGQISDNKIIMPINLGKGEKSDPLKIAWTVYDESIYYVKEEICPFKYKEYFKSIDEVCFWVKNNFDLVDDYSDKFDELFNLSNMGNSFNKMLSYTFHSWLMNTWWTTFRNEDWLTIWEGTCYYNSTVDVEYTQAPFYIAIWPELLKMQLNQWRYLSEVNETTIIDKGIKCRRISHDIGTFVKASHQYYSHDMDIEENSNYLLLLYAYWKRTNESEIIGEQIDFICELLNYIILSTPEGESVPTKNCANTIDDAFDAIQYGKRQVYLSIKVMAAFNVAIELLENIGIKKQRYQTYYNNIKKFIEEKAWKEDHFVVLMDDEELEGKDAYHIYSTNGLMFLNMFGKEIEFDNKRLKEDLVNGYEYTIGRYGCRHSSFINNNNLDEVRVGEVAFAPKVGWISMNITRDIVAAYNQIDFINNIDKYWDWQNTVNSQSYCLFFESFNGNNLHWYPRGVVIFGCLDAMVGYKYDNDFTNLKPIRANLYLPILSTVNWENLSCTVVKTYIDMGKLKYKVINRV